MSRPVSLPLPSADIDISQVSAGRQQMSAVTHSGRLLLWEVCLSVCRSVCLSVCLYVCLSVCLSIRPSVCLAVSVRLSVHFMYMSVRVKEKKIQYKNALSVYLSVCLCVRLSVCLFVRPSVCLSVRSSVCAFYVYVRPCQRKEDTVYLNILCHYLTNVDIG